MEAKLSPHSRAMTHRMIVALAVAASLVACLGKTTSLGGPSGNLSSASSSEDGGEDGGTGRQVVAEEFDAGPVTRSDGLHACFGYSWDPVPTAVPCEYLLPSGTPPNDDPRLDPSSPAWRTGSTTIDVIIPMHWRQGTYVGSSEGCGAGDGWYYLEDADADAQPETHTRFAICPASCASIANDGALLRLSTITHCEE